MRLPPAAKAASAALTLTYAWPARLAKHDADASSRTNRSKATSVAATNPPATTTAGGLTNPDQGAIPGGSGEPWPDICAESVPLARRRAGQETLRSLHLSRTATGSGNRPSQRCERLLSAAKCLLASVRAPCGQQHHTRQNTACATTGRLVAGSPPPSRPANSGVVSGVERRPGPVNRCAPAPHVRHGNFDLISPPEARKVVSLQAPDRLRDRDTEHHPQPGDQHGLPATVKLVHSRSHWHGQARRVPCVGLRGVRWPVSAARFRFTSCAA